MILDIAEPDAVVRSGNIFIAKGRNVKGAGETEEIAVSRWKDMLAASLTRRGHDREQHRQQRQVWKARNKFQKTPIEPLTQTATVGV
jgi:hypothetical protein